jgi:hypothetical protein
MVDNHSLHARSSSLRFRTRRIGVSTRRLSGPRETSNDKEDDIVPERMNISDHLSLLLKSFCPAGVLFAIVSDNARMHSKSLWSRSRGVTESPLRSKSSSMPILQTTRCGGTSKRTGRWDVGASKNDNLSTENLSKCGQNARWGSSTGNSSVIQNIPKKRLESMGLFDLCSPPSSRSSKNNVSRSSNPEVQGSKNASWGLSSSNKLKSGTNMKYMEEALGISSLNHARIQLHVQCSAELPSTPSSNNRFGGKTSSDRWSIPTRSSDSMLVRPKRSFCNSNYNF